MLLGCQITSPGIVKTALRSRERLAALRPRHGIPRCETPCPRKRQYREQDALCRALLQLDPDLLDVGELHARPCARVLLARKYV